MWIMVKIGTERVDVKILEVGPGPEEEIEGETREVTGIRMIDEVVQKEGMTETAIEAEIRTEIAGRDPRSLIRRKSKKLHTKKP